MEATTKNSEILSSIPNNEFLITTFGAVGDGVTDNTLTINNVIEECYRKGGGKVIFPPGIWSTGPIKLKSRVNLHVEAGAVVQFSEKFEDYPLILSSFEGEEVYRCQSPLDGENLEYVAITGTGIFDGNGHAWRPVKKWKTTELQWEKLISQGGFIDSKNEVWWPTEQAFKGSKLDHTNNGKRELEPFREFFRPNLFSIRKSNHILIDGPTFQNSPAWCIHPWLCEDVKINNITVRNPWYSQNGDGLDIESCKFVKVENCLFDVGDDAICIKSGKDESGRKLGIPSEHIHIQNCIVYSGHGGFVIGSEMSGGINDVNVHDCTFIGTDTGLRFKTRRGRGGIVENIVIKNIRMINIQKESIVFQMFYEENLEDITLEPITEGTPIFRNVLVENVISTNSEIAIKMIGLPEMPINNIQIINSQFQSTEGIHCSHCSNLTFTNVKVNKLDEDVYQLEHCRNIIIN